MLAVLARAEAARQVRTQLAAVLVAAQPVRVPPLAPVRMAEEREPEVSLRLAAAVQLARAPLAAEWVPACKGRAVRQVPSVWT